MLPTALVICSDLLTGLPPVPGGLLASKSSLASGAFGLLDGRLFNMNSSFSICCFWESFVIDRSSVLANLALSILISSGPTFESLTGSFRTADTC